MGRVLFRAASGARIGMGHALRSLAVAERVVEAGGEALLVVDDPDSAAGLRELHPAAAGLTVESAAAPEVLDLDRVDTAWLDGFRTWQEELEALRAADVPVVLVENRTRARECVQRILYPALHHEHDAWDRAHPERVLSGPRWIPLRRGVVEATATERDIDLLVTFGGSDPNRLTERVLAQLTDFAGSVAVAVGPHMHARRGALGLALGEGEGRSLLATGADLAPWIARARSAITAVGTTLAELAFHGVPAWILANYEQDETALAWYGRSGLHRPLGWQAAVTDEELRRSFRGPAALKRGAAGPESLDGRGAQRLAELLLAS